MCYDFLYANTDWYDGITNLDYYCKLWLGWIDQNAYQRYEEPTSSFDDGQGMPKQDNEPRLYCWKKLDTQFLKWDRHLIIVATIISESGCIISMKKD